MTPKVPDIGHREADKELYALTKRLHLSYRQASINLSEKLEKYLDKFEKEDAEKRALYDSGELNHDDYMAWRARKIAGTEQWRRMLDQLTNDMVNQDKIAASMIDDTLPGVYAINHNYGTYEAEVGSGMDTAYTLYDKFTVKRLLTDKESVLPYPDPSVDIPKDELWNRQHIQSAVLQGILTGESMGGIAERFQEVVGMDERASIRNARTAVTGAENAGRVDSYIRAEKMGIKMKQVWMATLDGRTRDSHAILDGEQQEVGKNFSNKCRYPGDPQGAPSEIYNCRCTLVALVEGADPYDPNLRASEYLKKQGLTYEEWKKMHTDRYNAKKDIDSIEIPHSKLHPEYSYATNYFKGVVDENNYRQLIQDKQYEIRDVVIRELYTDQEVNKVDDIRRMLKLNSDEPVVVVHVNGKDILLDGNTRSIASELLGNDTIKAKYYDLEIDQNPEIRRRRRKREGRGRWKSR